MRGDVHLNTAMMKQSLEKPGRRPTQAKWRSIAASVSQICIDIEARRQVMGLSPLNNQYPSYFGAMNQLCHFVMTIH